MTGPTIINPERQDFDGRTYRRDGKYFKHKDGERLHRAVWSAFWGPIPEDFHVHHIDEDPANNRLENLSCLSVAEHLRHHWRKRERKPKTSPEKPVLTVKTCGRFGTAFTIPVWRNKSFCSWRCRKKVQDRRWRAKRRLAGL